MKEYNEAIKGNRVEIKEELDGEIYLYDATLQRIIAFGQEEELRQYVHNKEMYLI